MFQEHYLRKKSNILCKNRKDVKPKERLFPQFKTAYDNLKAGSLVNHFWQQEIIIYDPLLEPKRKICPSLTTSCQYFAKLNTGKREQFPLSLVYPKEIYKEKKRNETFLTKSIINLR